MADPKNNKQPNYQISWIDNISDGKQELATIHHVESYKDYNSKDWPLMGVFTKTKSSD